MRRLVLAVVSGVVLALTTAPAAADEGSRSLVFRLRFTGLVATATWTTCPHPSTGAVCTDTTVLAFDSATREGRVRDRGPVLRTLTFVYRVVGGELGTVPVAEWFGRTEDAVVRGGPRLDGATATGTVPVLLCSVFDATAGVACPARLPVALAWTGTGALTRVADHTVTRSDLRLENAWTRGRQRTASVGGLVGGARPGVLVAADLSRVDQGEVVVQHPVP